uniref:Reverse transcriptase domain-containing protein n=1 Tax=Tanacetum cinerariifolium TaxID=118510 RepID=A0A6L2LFW8_TANCI|nr:reverse transcriptase domain-containing protein [Tanacetum cinerariifolium]
MQNQLTNLTDLITKFVNSNTAFTSSSSTLPSNTIANPRSDLKAITTRIGVSYDGPQIPPPPPSLPKVVKDEPEVTKGTVNPTNNGNTKDVQPQAVQSESPVLTSKPVTSLISKPTIALVSASSLNPKALIPHLSKRNDETNREKANNRIEKFYLIFKDMSFKISFVDALILMPKFSSTLKALIGNKEKLSEMAQTLLNEHCSAVLLKKLPKKLGDPGIFLILCDFPGMAECLALADLGASINLMPFFVWKKLSLPDLTPTCMTLELADRSISRPARVAEDVYVKAGSFYFPTDFVVVDFDVDPRVPLILERSFLKTGRDLVDVFEGKLTLRIGNDEPPMVELKDLPPHLEYTFLEGDDKLPVIIAKDLSVEEKTAIITVLKSHKRAIAWKLSDIKGINPEFCTHKILMEEDFKLAVQHQRRVNPKIHDVIRQEVIKLLKDGLIYPISDSPWVSPVHCVPKKGGFIVVENEDNELIPTRLVMGWRVCIDYCKLNEATQKDHFPLPFMDQMLERLAGNHYYCFLDGFSSYFQISIDPKDQEKTTFTCPYRTFAYCRMPFGLCNAPGENHASWSDKLDDALWAFRTAYKTPIGCTPYKLTTGDHRKVQINEFNELRDQAYENSLIYKEKSKRLYDSKIKNRVFNIGDRVLLFNSRLKILSKKLKSHWSGPFTISKVFPYGTVELTQPDRPNFRVNGHHLKHYFGLDIPKLVVPDLQNFSSDH